MGYTAPKNAVCKSLVVAALGKEGRGNKTLQNPPKWTLMSQKCLTKPDSMQSGENLQMYIGICLQQLLQQTSALIAASPSIQKLEPQGFCSYGDAIFMEALNKRSHVQVTTLGIPQIHIKRGLNNTQETNAPLCIHYLSRRTNAATNGAWKTQWHRSSSLVP